MNFLRAFFVSLGLLGALAVAAAPAAPRPVERIAANGRAYLRVSDWARTHELSSSWLVPGKTLQLAGGGNRLWLTLDSPGIRFNDIRLYLSLPVAGRDGALYLAELDAARALEPLLNPPRLPVGRKVRTICLDPGHGGRDSGNQEAGRQEKQFTLLLAKELRTQLAQRGFKVVMTRGTDTYVDLPERPKAAARAHADLFVSLHFNAVATGKGAVRGAETYCLTPAGASSTNARGVGAETGGYPGNRFNAQNVWLACKIQSALLDTLKTDDRGVRRARFAVLRDATMPAVLVEAGFMSHPAEGQKIFSTAYRQQMARAIADGIVAYKKTVERPG
ncbi:MAG TPA: N-acetylmuramoyl-L-alanine amidase [Verrucomicrobiae bacterium]|nr:N-acetylmuramoyl-L-alanine amidase [Verrucomicrobiae bacterium]